MAQEQTTEVLDLTEVEAELCRLPEVTAVRLVGDHIGRPLEVHVLADSGKPAKQIVRDVQSVALASFGLELDRRIVSVVQLGANGAGRPAAVLAEASTARTRVLSVRTQSNDLRTTVHVTLTSNDDECTGFADGSVAASTRPRVLAEATLDALRQIEPAAERLDVETAQITRVGLHDVALVMLVSLEPPHERRLLGSSIVHQHSDDAVVRAVLDATNRRLPHLARDHERT